VGKNVLGTTAEQQRISHFLFNSHCSTTEWYTLQ